MAVAFEFGMFQKHYILGTVVICLALLAGLRSPEIGRDYQNYLYSFETIYTEHNPLLFVFYEPGFVAIVFLIRLLFLNNYGIIIMLLIASISVCIKAWKIRSLSINPYTVILLYFSHFFLLQEMTQIRIGLATAFFFIAISYFLKRNFVGYILLILFATLFHYTALFYLVLLFLRTDKFNRVLYIGVLASALLFAFIPVPLISYLGNLQSNEFSGKVDNYVMAAELGIYKVNVLNAITICNILGCLYLIFAIAPRDFEKDKKLTFFLKCNILSIFLLSFFSGIPSIAFRLSDMLGILSMFCFAYLVRYLPFGKYNIFIVIALAGVFLYFFALNTNGLVKPYKMAKFV